MRSTTASGVVAFRPASSCDAIRSAATPVLTTCEGTRRQRSSHLALAADVRRVYCARRREESTMNNATWSMLNETEKALLRDAEPAALAKLDEDQLLALHDRIRRARTKYTKLYRRRATKQVARDASRGRAEEVHERTAVKAEAFEVALARVSRALARAAKDAADELKAERLSAA